jgi:SMI1 / KNR4 family (SUKH-1)
MQQLALQIESGGLARPAEIAGCTQEEVSSLEKRFGIVLPEIYRDWLRVMGRGAGHYLEGSDAFYPGLLELRDAAGELLRENGQPFSLAQDAFVFLMHQGYQFLYFRTEPLDPDPPVILYLEGESPEQKWEHVSDYFKQVLDDHLRLLGR